MEPGTSVVLYVAIRVIGLPIVAAAAGLIAARLAGARPGAAGFVGVGAAVGIGVALLGLAGVPALPPVDSIGWIPIAVAATIIVLIPTGGMRGVPLVAVFVLAAASAYLVGRPVWT